MVAVLQQQLRAVGIALDIRTFEFATFFADVTSGAYQIYSLRWIGGNEDPTSSSTRSIPSKFPPHGANRSYLRQSEDRRADQSGPRRNRPRPAKPVYD